MDVTQFISKTDHIVKLLTRLCDNDDYFAVATIVTAQANMDTAKLIKCCEDVANKIYDARHELITMQLEMESENNINTNHA